VPATAVATTTVESTTTAASVEAAPAHVAVVAATGVSAAAVSAAIGHPTSISVAISRVSIPIHRPSIVPAAIAVIAPAVPISVIPGPGTNEHPAQEPRGSIVAVRRAGIRIVAVIAISANGSRVAIPPVHRASNSNSNRNLSVGVSCSRDQQDTQ
jgi:hypothetical protein